MNYQSNQQQYVHDIHYIHPNIQIAIQELCDAFDKFHITYPALREDEQEQDYLIGWITEN